MICELHACSSIVLQVDSIVLNGSALRCLLAYQDQVCQCWGSWPWMGSLGWDTLVPGIVEHIEINEHLIIITPKLIIEHLLYTIYCIKWKNTWIFFTALIVKRVWLLGTPEYVVGECQAINCQSDTVCMTGCLIVLMGVCTLLTNFN